MYTPLQLKFIERFGRKDLKYGCLFKYRKGWDDDILSFCKIYDDTGNTKTLSYLPPDKEMTWEINGYSEDTKIEILGHEPHLFPDVARVAKEKGWSVDIYSSTGKEPQSEIAFADSSGKIHESIDCNPTLPLLDQPKVMEQLLDLFPDNNK